MAPLRKPPSKLSRAVQKYGVSAFVIGSFAAYALHERAVNPDSNMSAALATPVTEQVASAPTRTLQDVLLPTTMPATALPALDLASPTAPPVTARATRVVPTAPPAPTTPPEPSATSVPQPAAPGQLKDGTFDGPVVDAYYGNVQVEATVKSGQIVNVQFLDYPHDRRTSQRINRVAMPYLMQEAIQVQGARVHIISGATLTSEAFAQSLQSALETARS